MKFWKFCKICDAKMPLDRAHILCEACRIACGGYPYV